MEDTSFIGHSGNTIVIYCDNIVYDIHIQNVYFYYFQNTSTIFLKAHLEYLRGNYEKAIQFLNSNMKETDFKYVTYILTKLNTNA